LITLQQLKIGVITPDTLGLDKRIKLAEGLTEFPRELFRLADHIEILDLGGNQLSALPDDFHRFKNLKILFLTDNHFEHIPVVLSQCKKLEMVAFKSNKLKTLEENCLPNNIHWLILTNNQIKHLPTSMGKLTKLRKLALAGNQITSLPDSMSACTQLELVRLSANQLTVIPDWLLGLPKLSWLAFSGNPALEVVNTVKAQIPQIPLNSLKLNHQIGEGASGVIYHADWTKRDEQTTDRSSIAVKLFKGAVTSDGYPQDEIQCCLNVGEHPNLIKVLSHIDDANELGLVMELISSEFKNLGLPPSLATCTRDTFVENLVLSSTDVLSIVAQMADTLKHMHDQKVSHGDIYAHNTMIDSESKILFGDFGAATNLETLNPDQKQKMQRIEVRAFGCFMDDLLALVVIKDQLYDILVRISKLTMNDDILQRPNFAEICTQIESLKQ
jgi:hypothetical protein